MKSITISQPFASLIISGDKYVENRSWETFYRGPIAIHAGKGRQYLDREALAAYPTGCVIGTAQLVACLHLSQIVQAAEKHPLRPVPGLPNLTWGELREHQHTEGPFCWILLNVQPLETPIAVAGQQGLWEFKHAGF